MQLQELVQSFIDQHLRKYGYFAGYLYLTHKQREFYESLLSQRVQSLRKTAEYGDAAYKLYIDGANKATLYPKDNDNMKLSYCNTINDKSFCLTICKEGQKLDRIWIKNDKGYAKLNINADSYQRVITPIFQPQN